MGDKTGIEWTDATWNPTSGCTKVSAGCKNCYAERVFPRAYGKPRKFTDVEIHENRLSYPLAWKRPRRIFVDSMSDLFHESIPINFVDKVFAVMAMAPKHSFQVLTKRAAVMLAYLTGQGDWKSEEHPLARIRLAACELCFKFGLPLEWGDEIKWPVPNVWLGVSVEDQAAADERIPLLLETPAAVRFLSCEPLLGPVDLLHGVTQMTFQRESLPFLRTPLGVDWVIVGGESGPRARPMKEAWAQQIVDDCRAARVAVFMKQGSEANWFGFKNFAGFPESLQVREYPRLGTRAE